jgi:hypothetical protein
VVKKLCSGIEEHLVNRLSREIDKGRGLIRMIPKGLLQRGLNGALLRSSNSYPTKRAASCSETSPFGSGDLGSQVGSSHGWKVGGTGFHWDSLRAKANPKEWKPSQPT